MNKKSVYYNQYVTHDVVPKTPPFLYRVLKKYELHRLDAIDQLLGSRKFKHMLDIGCGDGGFLYEQQKRAKKVSGIEIVPELTRKASKLPFKKPHSFKTVDVGVSPLPFKDSSFDLVTTVATLQCVSDLDLLFSEIHRVLEKKGTFIYEVPNFLVFWRRIQMLFGKLPHTSLFENGWNGGIINTFSQERLTKFSKQHGFEVKQITCSGIFYQVRRWHPELLGANLIIECKKI